MQVGGQQRFMGSIVGAGWRIVGWGGNKRLVLIDIVLLYIGVNGNIDGDMLLYILPSKILVKWRQASRKVKINLPHDSSTIIMCTLTIRLYIFIWDNLFQIVWFTNSRFCQVT